MIRTAIISALLAITSPVHAEGLPELAPCLSPSASIDATADRLGALGWTTPDKLGDTTIAQLAWANMVFYFTGDSGGESLQSIYDLSLKSARGLTRKVDIDTSKARFMVRENGGEIDVLQLAWRLPVPNVEEAECTLILTAQATQELRAGQNEQPMFAPIISSTPGVQITLLDRASLSGALGQTVTADAVVRTHMSREVAQ